MDATFLIPWQILAQWLTFLWQALPVKLRPTLLELLVGNMISGAGHVIDAILAVLGKTNWTNYFKALQSNGYSWLKLSHRWKVGNVHKAMAIKTISGGKTRTAGSPPPQGIHLGPPATKKVMGGKSDREIMLSPSEGGKTKGISLDLGKVAGHDGEDEEFERY